MADIVSVAEALKYLRRTQDQGGLIAQLLPQITAAIEKHCRRAFTKAARTEDLDGAAEDLILTYRPIASVTTVTDLADGTVLTEADDFGLDADGGLLFLHDGDGLPSCRKWGRGRARYRVAYLGGHDGAPADVKHAALLWITARFNRPDAAVAQSGAGDHSFFLGAGTNATAMPAEVAERLANYVEVLV